MGGIGSKLSRPSRVSSGRELKVQTKEVAEMANALFLFMYTQWEDKEIYDIARNPGDYVIALSDLITNKFHVLGYVTKRNQIGEIYFAKYSALKPPSQDSDRGMAEQRENAQLIAFYFVRLFQMMSALLLVVKDIDWRDIGSPAATFSAEEEAIAAGRLALQQGVVLPRFQPPTSQRGGAASSIDQNLILGPYECLRNYIRPLSSSELTSLQTLKAGLSANTFKVSGTENLFFELVSNTVTKGSTSISRENFPKQRFHLLVKRAGTKTESAYTQDVKVGLMLPTVINGVKSPAQESTPQAQLARYPQGIQLDLVATGSSKSESVNFERTEDVVTFKDNYANGAKYKIQGGIGFDALSTLFDPEKNLPQMLEAMILLVARKYQADSSIQLSRSPEKKNEGAAVRVEKETQLPLSLKNPALDEVYKLLKSKKGQPHCIARAIQLIDLKSLEKYMPTGAKTSICKFSVGEKVQPSPLSDYIPLKSVASLFGRVNPTNFKDATKILSAFVLPGTGQPLSVSDLEAARQPDEAKKLQEAIKSLQLAFNLSTDGKADGFQDLQISRPAECKTSETMDVGSQALSNRLQSTAQQLLAFHVNMCVEISKFLKGVFNIKQMPDGSFRVVGPKTEILFAGFPALDQLVLQARGLLVDYYSGCEKLYQGGVALWQKEQPAPLVAAAPAVPAPAPAAT